MSGARTYERESLEQKGGEMTIRDLKCRFKSEKSNIEEAVKSLVTKNIFEHRELPKSGPGRPREIYRVTRC
jgi:predicted transcriptional regulator